MRLTKRGKRVRAVACVLVVVLFFSGVSYLKQHTKYVDCHAGDLGWECRTAWKP